MAAAAELLAVAVAFEAAGKPLVMESFVGCRDYKVNLSTENVYTKQSRYC